MEKVSLDQGKGLLYHQLYTPLPNRAGYLSRIGAENICGRNLMTLDFLISAHQRSVPFENLDVYDGHKDISIAISDLYAKIVERRRGGYCFELNGLFMSLLQDLGYDCYPLAARVLWNQPELPPCSHRATVVRFQGKRYFCDVGFGGPSPDRALVLDTTDWQETGNGSFMFTRKEHLITLSRRKDGQREELLQFADIPYDPVDFLPLNEFKSKSSLSRFTRNRFVSVRTLSGSCSISENVLRVVEYETTREIVLHNAQDWRQALHDYFGITVDFPLRIEE